jgi:hypothetical protein
MKATITLTYRASFEVEVPDEALLVREYGTGIDGEWLAARVQDKQDSGVLPDEREFDLLECLDVEVTEGGLDEEDPDTILVFTKGKEA